MTSGQGNDMVIFTTEGRFSGAHSDIADIARSVTYDMPIDFLLAQYPSDVSNGERLVLDKNFTPIKFRPFMEGSFHSIDLASWSGSSGGPIIDIAASNAVGSPVVVGVLMSSGWSVCDSGIVPVSMDSGTVRELLEATSETLLVIPSLAPIGRGNGSRAVLNSWGSRGDGNEGNDGNKGESKGKGVEGKGEEVENKNVGEREAKSKAVASQLVGGDAGTIATELQYGRQ